MKSLFRTLQIEHDSNLLNSMSEDEIRETFEKIDNCHNPYEKIVSVRGNKKEGYFVAMLPPLNKQEISL